MITPRQCRAARGLLGWSQADLANACGMSKTAINNFEMGNSSIKQVSMHAIIQAFEDNNIDIMEHEGVRFKHNSVRIIRGDQPLFTLWNEILSTMGDEGGEVLINSVNESEGYNKYGKELDAYIEKLKKAGITERLLAKEGQTVFAAPREWYRFISEEAFNSGIMTFIFKDKVALMLWKESVLLLIESEEAAAAEKERFETIWKTART
ncbi:MAG: transcriptional regulator [Micavibrio sp.]|nr:transcriptional regulator [Micavibrio sp.]